MLTLDVHKTEVDLPALLALVEQGEEVIIAQDGAPVALLTPYKPPGKREPGAWKGVVAVGGEFSESLPTDELAMWENR